jgi:hypothetical protein
MKFLVVYLGGELRISTVFHCDDGVYHQTQGGRIERIADKVTGTRSELEFCFGQRCAELGYKLIGEVQVAPNGE